MRKKEKKRSSSDQDENRSSFVPQEEKENYVNSSLVKYEPHAGSVSGIQADCTEENREDDGDTPSGGWFIVLGCALAHVVIAPLASAITNKFSARISVFTGGILAALGVFISAFAPSLPFLYISYGLITGIGGSLAHTPGLVTVGQYFKSKRGLAVGLSTAGTGVGMFVFPPLFEYIFQEFNYFGAFLILSAIPLHMCVSGALYRPLRLHKKIGQIQRNASEAGRAQNKNLKDQSDLCEDESEVANIQKEAVESGTEAVVSLYSAPKSVSEVEYTFPQAIPQNASSEHSYTPSKKESICCRLCMKWKHKNQADLSDKKQKSQILEVKLLKQPGFTLFSISLCLFTACFKAGFTFLPAMAKSNGCSETQAALLLSLAGVLDTFCRIGSGILLDLKKVQRFRPLIYNGIPFAISIVLFLCPMMSSFPGFAIMAALFGCLTGSFTSQKTVILIDILGKDKLRSSLGLLTCIQGLGMLFGPPLSDIYMSMLKAETDGSAGKQHGNNSPLLSQEEETEAHMPSFPATLLNGTEVDCKENTSEVITEKEEDDTQTGGYKWIIVLGCALAHVIIGGLARSDGVLYLKLIEKFEGTAKATALVSSLSSTFEMLFAPLTSAVTNRFSARLSVFTGGIIAALGVFISGFAHSLTFLYFSFGIITGIGRSLGLTPGLITVGQYFKKKRGLAVGLSTAGVGLGTLLYPPLFEYSFDEFNYFGAFLILSAIPLNLCTVGALYRPITLQRKISQLQRNKEKTDNIKQKTKETYFPPADDKSQWSQTELVKNGSKAAKNRSDALEDQREATEDETEALRFPQEGARIETKTAINLCNETKRFCEEEHTFPEVIPQNLPFEHCRCIKNKKGLCHKCYKNKEQQNESMVTKKKSKFLDLSLLKNPAFALFCIGLCVFRASFKAGFTFLPALAKSRGCNETQATLLLSIAGICDTICRIGSGIVFDLKRLQQFRSLIYNGLPFAIALVLFLCPTMSSFPGFALMTALFGCLSGSFISQKTVILIDILGVDKLASSLGLLIGIQGLGVLVGPPLSGALKDAFGRYEESFYFSAVAVVVAGLIMITSNVIRAVKQRRSSRGNRLDTP